MAGKGGKGKDTGTVFLNQTVGKFGTFYSGAFPDVGVVQMEFNADKDLVVKSGAATDLIKPKTNDYGDYYLAKIGDQKYFVSQRTNSKGPYVMAKIAPEKTDAAGRPDRPESYSSRK